MCIGRGGFMKHCKYIYRISSSNAISVSFMETFLEKNENANSMKLYSKWSAFSASTNGAYWNFASKYSCGFTSLNVIPPIWVLNQFQRMNDGASSNVHNYMDDFYELAPTDGELLSFKVIDEPVNLLINR